MSVGVSYQWVCLISGCVISVGVSSVGVSYQWVCHDCFTFVLVDLLLGILLTTCLPVVYFDRQYFTFVYVCSCE